MATSEDVSKVLAQLEADLRSRFDPLGCFDEENGAYMTGHVPHVAPLAYLCRRYAGLDAADMAIAEGEAARYIPEPYQAFLETMNGGRLLGVSLAGAAGSLIDRTSLGVGQPISLRYGNYYGRPDFIPNGHFQIGAINGERYSQGVLYLASTGEVEMYLKDHDLIGARWPSLAHFLDEEIRRRFALFDDEGVEISPSERLPGDTTDWESISEAARLAKRPKGLLQRLRRRFWQRL